MTLDLAERWVADKRHEPTYPAETLRFVQEQFEKLRSQPALVDSWLKA